MRLLLSVTISLVCTTYAAAQDAPTVPPTPPTAEAPSSNATSEKNLLKALTLLERSNGVAIKDPHLQTREAVLVVPTPELSPEALAAVSEDMAVMCRILDKTLPSAARSATTLAYLNTDPFSQFLGDSTHRAQGLYLDGYGALFFVQVDFPLVAPPQEKTEDQPQESPDRVWADTMNELRGQPSRSSGADEEGPAYDAQKVENLKAALIKTLRHAANLRVHTPQDIIVVAAGARADGAAFSPKQLFYGDMYGGAYGDPVVTIPSTKSKRGVRSADGPALDPAGTLVLRVAKADVDAFAAGSLTLEQFTPKVQILWSAQPQAPEPPTPPAAGVSR